MKETGGNAQFFLNIPRDNIETEPFLHLRYDRTDCALMCSVASFPASSNTSRHGDFLASFMARYKREFGFVIPERLICVDDIRVRGTGKTFIPLDAKRKPSGAPPRADKVMHYICSLYFPLP